MRESENIRMVKKVARTLGDMCEDVVFVGGAVVELYATVPSPPPVRPTVDVDCVVQITSRKAFRRIEKRLEERGFRHDTSGDAPLCRWLCDDLQVDVMPTHEDILGFANRWHAEGIDHAIQYPTEEGTEIRLLPAPFFTASKLEALGDRGGNDRRGEPDFEDVVFILDNRIELPSEVKSASVEVREYLVAQFETLLASSTIREDIVSVLPPGEASSRVEHVLKQMRRCCSPEEAT